MLPLVMLIALLGAALGLWLIVTGYRRQREFTCARCGYLLIGLNDASRCPECGCTLDGSNIRTPGEIRTVWWRLIAGTVLLAPATLLLFVLIFVFFVGSF
jgi:uncharacterized paraquat-inducible protein A